MLTELYGLELPLSLPAIEDTSGTACWQWRRRMQTARKDAGCRLDLSLGAPILLPADRLRLRSGFSLRNFKS